jgi:uncharacterized protein YfdQ (DUF2303 family)
MSNDNLEVNAIRDLARQTANPQTAEKIHYVIVPKDSDVVSLMDEQYPHGLPPDRIVASSLMQDAKSFCSYVNSFKDHRTRIFADAQRSSFLAVLDYHPADAGAPQFLSHRCALNLKPSEEWSIWQGKHDKLIPQAEFAEFLEDNRADILKPDAATMLEIAKDLQAHSEVNFASKINSHNGATTLSYDEQIKASVSTGQVTIPETFTIHIPIFFGENPIDVHARLRFRISSGKLSFQYKLHRPAEVLLRAFEEVRKGIAAAADLEILLGTIGA